MPLIGEDRSVTFKYRNSEEKNVIVEGSFTEAKNMALIDRTWILHVDSLPSEMYTYSFYDGKKKFLDPCNPNVVRDITDTLNYFIVDGFPGSYYKKQNVPHGKVRQLWYPSSFNENMKQRRLSVYLPADYDVNLKKTYPVLYLLHGTGGDEMAWLDMGRLSQIMDNMIAQGKAKPMIVVFTNGNISQEAAPGENSTGYTRPTTQLPKTMDGTFEASFPEIVKFIDANYKTIAKKQGRAICGLSMGGFHTLYISLNYPDLFDYSGMFSAAIGVNEQQMCPMYDNFDKKLAKYFSKKPAMLWIGCGNTDFLYKANIDFMEKMTQAGYPFEYMETEGGHIWRNWRIYLSEFVPLLFK